MSPPHTRGPAQKAASSSDTKSHHSERSHPSKLEKSSQGSPKTPGKSSDTSSQRGPDMLSRRGSITTQDSFPGPQHLALLDFKRKRASSWQGHPLPVKVMWEPSYRLEPQSLPDQKKIHKVMETELEQLLSGLTYIPQDAALWTRNLADRITAEVKLTLPENHRYKLVATVNVTPRMEQSLQIASRCLWEKEFDSSVTATFQNKTLHAIATLYFLYFA